MHNNKNMLLHTYVVMQQLCKTNKPTAQNGNPPDTTIH